MPTSPLPFGRGRSPPDRRPSSPSPTAIWTRVMRGAIVNRGMFHLLETREGGKVDFSLLTDDEVDRARARSPLAASLRVDDHVRAPVTGQRQRPAGDEVPAALPRPQMFCV